ncbi:MAG: hypothetical protein LZF60_10011 [Nitrospira sp.]|nr:hypothetical protein [Nitrospira sp.]ULA57893.1 MAG: hypothetical protein LZF60_10011 [Nitrospira sp.]
MDAWVSQGAAELIGRQRTRLPLPLALVLGMTSILGWGQTGVEGRDLMVPKEQTTTEFEPTETPSLDVQQKGVPQSLFTWIKMARGYEVEWDTFGRKGWFTQDPRLKPIAPGTTVFTPDTPAVYIVFEVAPLEDPAQFAAQVFAIGPDGKTSDAVIVQDSLEVPGHERYGFLELKKPSSQWPQGKYVVKIYITSLGQQPFHAVNQVGTMRFAVTDQPSGDVPPPASDSSTR